MTTAVTKPRTLFEASCRHPKNGDVYTRISINPLGAISLLSAQSAPAIKNLDYKEVDVRGVFRGTRSSPVKSHIIIQHIRYMIIQRWLENRDLLLKDAAKEILRAAMNLDEICYPLFEPERTEIKDFSCLPFGIGVIQGNLPDLEAAFKLGYLHEVWPDWCSVLAPVMPDLVLLAI